MVTKFHAMLHFGDELRRFKTLLSCWVHERKHIMVRNFCNSQKNTVQFERSILGNVTCQQLHNLQHVSYDFSVHLMAGKLAPKELHELVCTSFHLEGSEGASVLYGRTVRFSTWGQASVGDAVLVRGAADGQYCAGWVWKNVSALGVPITLLQLGCLSERHDLAGFATWTLDDQPTWIPSRDILDVCVFAWDGPRVLRTLLPRSFR